MSVGEIVAASGVGQSTVSHHVKILAEARFVLVERQGTSSLYRINEACVSCFPTAADVVMGNPVPAAPTCEFPEYRTGLITPAGRPDGRLPDSLGGLGASCG